MASPEGWHKGLDGMLVKKWDPHAKTRAAAYEQSLKEHQVRRLNGEGASTYASNQASSVAERGAAARRKAALAKEEKVNRARKFNDRHGEAIARRHAAAAKPGRHAAAAGHEENERYMDDFRSAYGLAAPAPVAAAAVSPGALGALGRHRVASWAGPLDRGQLRSYRRGPADPRGALVDCSDRPLLCMSVSDDGRDVVVGSADHAAYGVDAADPRPRPARTYHGKDDGHAEWVAAVAHCGPHGVATGGVDGKLCLWRRGARAEDVAPAGGPSLSVLLADGAAPHLLFAAAYDGVARVYDVRGRRGAEVAVLAPKRGKAPALCAAWTPSTAVVGDRGGAATCYDVERCAAVASLKPAGAAAGHCVALEALEEMHGDLVVTGHQDGVIRGWDPRDGARPSFEIPAHASPRGAGAASCLARLGDGARLASCGADGRVALSDVRYGKPLLSFDDHADFPYCLAVLGDLLFTGAGDGALLCHDVSGAGSCEWGLGAGLGAVRCVDARPDQLVAAGDDGNVLLWRL